MRFGWCAPAEEAGRLADLGYDFIELPLAPMNLEDEAGLAEAKRRVTSLTLPPEAFNVFLPRDMRVVGQGRDPARLARYLGRAAEILALAEAKVVVFGSGWARNGEPGLSRTDQEAQLADGLHRAADALEGTGCTLVIEPLNARESDIITSVDEGAAFARAMGRPGVRLLADFYHMDEEGEGLDALSRHADHLSHVHLADTGRHNPGSGTYPYREFLAALQAGGFAGRLSCECSVDDPEDGRRQSLAFLRRAWEASTIKPGAPR